MSNKVSIIFEGDARDLFAKADAVEKRLNALGMKASTAPSVMLSGAQTPALDRIISAQKNLTRTVETEASRRSTAEIASAKAVTKAVEAEVAKQKAVIQSASAPSKLQGFRQEILSRQGPKSVDITKDFVGNLAGGLTGGQSPIDVLANQSGVLAEAFGRTAVSADAVAASTGKASASVTLMGASVVSLGAIAAAGLVTILAVKKATDDIQDSAEKRLKYEELVTSEFNKQNIFAKELAKLRAEAAEGRAFNRFVNTAPPELIQQRRSQLEQQEAAAKAKAAELARREMAVDAIVQSNSKGLFGGYSVSSSATASIEQLAAEREAAETSAQSFYDKILALDKGLEDSSQRRVDSGVAITKFAESARIEAIKDRIKLEEEAEKKRLDSIEKAKAKVVQMGAAIRSAFDSVTSRASAGDPFLQFLDGADKRMRDLRENTRGFSASLRGALVQIEQASNRKDLIGLRIDASIQANDLRTQAREFRQGFRNDLSNPATLQQIVDQQLRAIGGRSAGDPIPGPTGQAIVAPWLNRDGSALARVPLDPTQRAVQDQKLIDLAGRVDPAKIREDQRAAFSDALEREAKRRMDAESNAQAERTKQSGLLTSLDAEMKKLNALAQTGGLDAIVHVIDDSDLSNTTRVANPGDTRRRSKR